MNRLCSTLSHTVGALLVALPLVAVSQSSDDDFEWPQIISFATPSQGSSGHVAATILADKIRSNTDVRQVVVEPFGNAAAMIRPLHEGDAQFAFHGGFRPFMDAYYGEGGSESVGPQNVSNMLMFAIDPWGVLVTDPEIENFGDLRGKTVALLVNNADHVNVIEAYLEMYDMTRSDITILPVTSVASAYEWLRDGRADAFPFGMAPALQEVKQARGLWGLEVSDDEAEFIIEREPTRVQYTLEAGTTVLAPEEDLPFLGLPLGMAVNADVDAELVYQVMKVAYGDARDDLFAAKSNYEGNWTPEAAVEVFPFPFHEGAVRYLREVGVWNDELDQRQQELMR